VTKREDDVAATDHRFRFLRTVVNNRGVPFDCTLESIAIRRARSKERALAAAMLRFARKHRVSVWDHLAHRCESEDVERNANPTRDLSG
jgi:hypothetical protein